MVLNDFERKNVLLFRPAWFAAKPLKGFRWVLVHRQDLDLIQEDGFEVSSQCFDPLPVVMPDRDALGKIENSVRSILRLVANVSRNVSFVRLQPQVADIQQPSGTQHAMHLTDESSLAVVCRDACKNAEKKNGVDRCAGQRNI